MQIETVKNYCDITWSDEQTDDKVAGILDRAQSELESYAGETLDFSDEKTTLAQLLLDCCWYILNRVRMSVTMDKSYRSQRLPIQGQTISRSL